MADTPPSSGPTNAPLQFDTAQFASPEALVGELSCAACGVPLSQSYFEVNGQRVCARCKELAVNIISDSPFFAFFKAGLFGLLAGLAGCALYYGILALTGYEIGLIAIVVGLMVGAAVRKGSGNRGGWVYQIMAMLITYGSIVTSYVPTIVEELTRQQDDAPQIPTAVAAVIAWVIAWFAPFLSLPQNLIGVLIIAFGVYEAWKINQRRTIEVRGPFALTTERPQHMPVTPLPPPATS